MASLQLSHDDYTVAWFCALPLELAAVKAMLDDTHIPLRQPSADENSYTLGRMCDHNVVIACLPSYGTNSAATVLAQMRPTFPSLRFGLMVGIGGGVPGKADIRLGDVVVSKPTATMSGVVQYDLGKTGDKRRERTGILNKPPQILLTAIGQIESTYMTGQQRMQQFLSEVLARNEAMSRQFSRPRDDRLFLSTYSHNEGSDAFTSADCSACDRSQLVARAPRTTDEPFVHYGIIASGNQVIKDAQTRDRIAHELENQVLCFEMEAAGLMDQLPCLVIRGICDYCDSHKNKKWQGYAALTAAAYARELLTAVHLNDQRSPTSKKGKERLWLVPFTRNLQFTGRTKEIMEIRNLLSIPDGPRKIALAGLGGVGKTQVALNLAYHVRDHDADCSVFWISCVSHESVAQSYMNIARHLARQDVTLQNVSPADVKMRVKESLSHRITGKWLLIFDNADDTDMWISSDTAPALQDFLPQSDHGHIISTTRNRKLALALTPCVISISEMDEETAQKLLQSLIHKDLQDDKTTDLLQQLTFLPLAITQAAAYINANGISVSEYLALLQEQEQDVVELLSEDFLDEGRYTETQNPIATTWSISFRQIQKLNSTAAEYLLFMACIHPLNIPHLLLPSLPTQSEKKKTDALGLLNAYSFVNTQSNGFLNLHRLVHLAIRNWMRQQDLLTLWTSKAADRLCEIFPNDDISNRKLYRVCLPHMSIIVKESKFQDDKDRYMMLRFKMSKCLSDEGRYNEAEALLSDIIRHGEDQILTLDSKVELVWTYHIRGRWEEAEQLQLQMMEDIKQALGPQDLKYLVSITGLALMYLGQGRYEEAERLMVQQMEDLNKLFGPTHAETLMSMAHLAGIYRYLGRWREAEKLQIQVMESQMKILQFGAEHPNIVRGMTHLASDYRGQRRWEEAEKLQVQVMEINQRNLGAEHPETLYIMRQLASTYGSQGRWKEAEQLQLQVVEHQKQIYGKDSYITRQSLAGIGWIYTGQGRWKDAEELQVQVMDSYRLSLGAKHPYTLHSMASLAETYVCLGRLKEAENLQIQVMESRKQIFQFDTEHSDTLSSLIALAATYRHQGRLKEAGELQLHVVEATTRKFGEEHPTSLLSMGHLALTYKAQERWKEAERLQLQVVKASKQIYGEEDYATLRYIDVLALIYSGQGRWNEAEKLHAQVIQDLERTSGANHYATLISMANLAYLYQSQSRWKEAEKLRLQVWSSRKQILGAEDPVTIIDLVHLASIYAYQKRWEEAEKLYAEAANGYRRLLKTAQPKDLSTMDHLASLYRQLGRWKEAEELHIQVINCYRQIFGQVSGVEHPTTLQCMAKLGSTYYSQGRLREAEELHVRVFADSKQALGAEETLTLMSMGCLSLTWKSLGKDKEAVDLMESHIQLCSQHLGSDHPLTKYSMGILADWQNETPSTRKSRVSGAPRGERMTVGKWIHKWLYKPIRGC